jgi:hypothetical protein
MLGRYQYKDALTWWLRRQHGKSMLFSGQTMVGREEGARWTNDVLVGRSWLAAAKID